MIYGPLDKLFAEHADRLSSLTGRLHGNARSVLDRRPRDDEPAEMARQRYYGAHERYALVRDILELAGMADWALMLPELEQVAEGKRVEALQAYDDQMAGAAPPAQPAPLAGEVALPFDAPQAADV